MAHATQSEILPNDAKKNENTLALRSTITFSDDDLSEEAKTQFRFHEQILRNFQLFATHVFANDKLSPMGRHLACTLLERDYNNSKRVLNYAASHPEVNMTENSLRHPLIICSLPRTGSTLLFNLLACDPAGRAPMYAEIEEPVPPIPRSDTAGQKERETRRQGSGKTFIKLGLDDYLQNIRASHPEHTYEADMRIFYHAGFRLVYTTIVPDDDDDLKKWLENDTDKEFMYQYHKTFVQMVNSVDRPRSHWLFKAPIHTLYLDELLRCYPSAMLIMTHRRLADTLASAARLMITYAAPYFHDDKTGTTVNSQLVAKRMLGWLDTAIHRIVKFRRTHQNISCFDVKYEDLIANPIDAVRRIYKHYRLDYSEEFEMAMLQWLRENPQGKQGRNTYTINDYNMTPDEIELRYKDYNEMFLNSQNSSKVDSCMKKGANPVTCSTESSSNT